MRRGGPVNGLARKTGQPASLNKGIPSKIHSESHVMPELRKRIQLCGPVYRDSSQHIIST